MLAAYAYDAQLRRTSLTRGNGDVSAYGYSQASRLISLNHDLAGSANDANWAFGYNVAGQMISRSFAEAYERNVDALSQSYTANGLNQYASVGGNALNYDTRGNLVSDGARNFAYDYENRLISVSGSVSGTLSYDPLGRLHSYTTGGNTTEFLYDGDRLVVEYNGAGTLLRRYIHGPGVDEPLVTYEGTALTDRRHLIADRQGSIIAEAGVGVARYQYGPYGEPNTWVGSRFRYTGQIALPELALYHYKARVYDPEIGRFLQTDPVGYRSDLNLYSYVHNDPSNLSDPLGLEDTGMIIQMMDQGEIDDPYGYRSAPPGMFEVGGSYTRPWGSPSTRLRFGQTRVGVSVYETIDRRGRTTSVGYHIQFSPVRVGLERGGGLGFTYTPGDGAPPRREGGSTTITGALGPLNVELGNGGPNVSVQVFGVGDRAGASMGPSVDIYMPWERNGQSLQSLQINQGAGTVTATYARAGSRLTSSVTACFDKEKCH